jgi:DNA-binding NtrC family response regulator
MEKKRLLIVEDDYVEANDLRLIVEKGGYSVIGIARSVNQALDLVEQSRPTLALLDISLQGKLTGIDLARILVAKNIPFIYLSANCSAQTLEAARSTQPYGFLVKPFRKQDVLAALSIADYRVEEHAGDVTRQQSQLQTKLHNLSKGATLENENMLQLARVLQSYFPFDYLGFDRFSGEGRCIAANGYYRVGLDEYESVQHPTSSPQVLSDLVKPFYAEMDAELTSRLLGVEHQNTLTRLRMHSVMVIPLHWRDERVWLVLASRQFNPYAARHIELIERVLDTLRETIGNIVDPDPKLARSSNHSSPQVADRSVFSGIVGSSSSLLHVFDEIRQVAPLATSVLILGESGTGKEKIAESIHYMSERKEGPFIRINCAGFPASLIESELFGHEKGAFI